MKIRDLELREESDQRSVAQSVIDAVSSFGPPSSSWSPVFQQVADIMQTANSKKQIDESARSVTDNTVKRLSPFKQSLAQLGREIREYLDSVSQAVTMSLGLGTVSAAIGTLTGWEAFSGFGMTLLNGLFSAFALVFGKIIGTLVLIAMVYYACVYVFTKPPFSTTHQ